MTLENLFTRITHEAPSAPRRDTFIAPMRLLVCCACGFVQGKPGAIPGLEGWINQRTYREALGMNPTELELMHTYCPTCLEKVQETRRQFWLKSRSSPGPCSPALDASHRAVGRDPRNPGAGSTGDWRVP
jgi:hypothetical protein